MFVAPARCLMARCNILRATRVAMPPITPVSRRAAPACCHAMPVAALSTPRAACCPFYVSLCHAVTPMPIADAFISLRPPPRVPMRCAAHAAAARAAVYAATYGYAAAMPACQFRAALMPPPLPLRARVMRALRVPHAGSARACIAVYARCSARYDMRISALLRDARDARRADDTLRAADVPAARVYACCAQYAMRACDV